VGVQPNARAAGVSHDPSQTLVSMLAKIYKIRKI
jgi:hypothetical protein